MGDLSMVFDIHDPTEELMLDYDGLVHRTTRLSHVYPFAHCRDVWKPAMKYDAVPKPTFATCFWCITSRYRP